MAYFYYLQIKQGKKTLDEINVKWRDEVEALIDNATD